MISSQRPSLRLMGGIALLAFFANHCGDDGGTNNASGGQSSSGGQSNGGSANGGSASGGDGSGGLSSTIANVNGCTPATAEDHSAATADRKIEVGTAGLTFTPKCMAIKAGQSVSFQGTLAGHPLAPGNANSETAGSPNNPIMKTSSGTSVSFTFPTAGAYPYYCVFHSFGAGDGMSGVVYVIP
jgi:plastocyanin